MTDDFDAETYLLDALERIAEARDGLEYQDILFHSRERRQIAQAAIRGYVKSESHRR